jgi:hypothetical protein
LLLHFGIGLGGEQLGQTGGVVDPGDQPVDRRQPALEGLEFLDELARALAVGPEGRVRLARFQLLQARRLAFQVKESLAARRFAA